MRASRPSLASVLDGSGALCSSLTIYLGYVKRREWRCERHFGTEKIGFLRFCRNRNTTYKGDANKRVRLRTGMRLPLRLAHSPTVSCTVASTEGRMSRRASRSCGVQSELGHCRVGKTTSIHSQTTGSHERFGAVIMARACAIDQLPLLILCLLTAEIVHYVGHHHQWHILA